MYTSAVATSFPTKPDSSRVLNLKGCQLGEAPPFTVMSRNHKKKNIERKLTNLIDFKGEVEILLGCFPTPNIRVLEISSANFAYQTSTPSRFLRFLAAKG